VRQTEMRYFLRIFWHLSVLHHSPAGRFRGRRPPFHTPPVFFAQPPLRTPRASALTCPRRRHVFERASGSSLFGQCHTLSLTIETTHDVLLTTCGAQVRGGF